MKNTTQPVTHLRLDQIMVGSNVRTQHADPEKDKELLASVQTRGLLQPLLVRPRADGKYDLCAGGRRYAAATQAKLASVPVHVRNLTDAEMLECQLIENLQREGLHPLDEMQGFRRLLGEFKLTVETLQQRVNKSRTWVYDTLSLQKLTAPSQAAFRAGRFGRSVAIKLAAQPDHLQERGLELVGEGEESYRRVAADMDREFRTAEKRDKEWQKLAAAAKARGQTILTATEMRPHCYPMGHACKRDGRYIEVTEMCYDAPGYKSYQTLLAKSPVPFLLAQFPNGSAAEVVERAAARKWLTDNGKLKRKSPQPGRSATASKPSVEAKHAEAVRAVKDKQARLFATRSQDALHAKLVALKDVRPVLRLLLNAQYDQLYEVLQPRGYTTEAKFQKALPKMGVGELVGYLVESDAFYNNDLLATYAALLRVDLAAVQAKIEAELPLPTPLKPAAAKPAKKGGKQ